MSSRTGVPAGLMILLLCVLPRPVAGQLQSLPERLGEAGWSGVVLVSQNSETLLHEAFGLADRERNVRMELDTRFPVASITKVFTSALALRLSERGLLDLDAPISRYLPQYENPYLARVSVHQLLTHTSGLPVPAAQNKDENGVSAAFSQATSVDEVIRRYLSGPPRDSTDPHFEYNNGDYILLGKVIESAADREYEDVLQSEVLDPLGLTDTGLVMGPDNLEGVAKGYVIQEDESFRINPPMRVENYFASGAMYSTASDVLSFFDALFKGQVISDASLAKLVTTYPESSSYGYGAWIRYPLYHRTVAKVLRRYGRIHGLNHLVSYFIDDGISVIVLSNTDGLNPTVIEEIVGGLLFQR